MNSVSLGDGADHVSGLARFFAFHSALPQTASRIVRIQFRQFSQNFLRPLVGDARDNHFHFKVLIAVNAGTQKRRCTPPANTQRLPRLRSWRDADHGWPRSEEHTSELQSLTNLVCRL